MKTFLASANLEEIRWATERGLVDGVFTTPSLLAADGGDGGRERLADICAATTLPVSASVGAVQETDIYRDGRELARVADQVIVQIPFVEDALAAIKRLSNEGVRVAATLVYTAAQATLAAKVGASSVVIAVDELEEQGQDGTQVVRETRSVLDATGAECDVWAAFPRNAAQFLGCALAGADSIAVDAAVLKSLLVHPLTDRGIDRLLTDLSRHHKPRPVP
jgi:transaldolase